MKSIKWLKMRYSGLDMGAVYEIVSEWEGFLFFFDEFGRMQSFHNRYNGILYEVVK